jgi:hypothetical protein
MPNAGGDPSQDLAAQIATQLFAISPEMSSGQNSNQPSDGGA